MKTAVEYIELRLLGIASFDSEELRLRYKDIIKQAKEIEKEQMFGYVKYCYIFDESRQLDIHNKLFEDYYEETYNQTNETISKSKF